MFFVPSVSHQSSVRLRVCFVRPSSCVYVWAVRSPVHCVLLLCVVCCVLMWVWVWTLADIPVTNACPHLLCVCAVS